MVVTTHILNANLSQNVITVQTLQTMKTYKSGDHGNKGKCVKKCQEWAREHTCEWIKIYQPTDQHDNTEKHLWNDAALTMLITMQKKRHADKKKADADENDDDK